MEKSKVRAVVNGDRKGRRGSLIPVWIGGVRGKGGSSGGGSQVSTATRKSETQKPRSSDGTADGAPVTAENGAQRADPPSEVSKPKPFAVLSDLRQSFSSSSLPGRSRQVSETSRRSSISAKMKELIGISQDEGEKDQEEHDQQHAQHQEQVPQSENPQSVFDNDKQPSSFITAASLPTTSTTSASGGDDIDMNDPRLVTTAMPPQYWAGRFMALNDQLQNALLEPERLARVCMGQKPILAPSSSNTAAAAAAAHNNPSTSAYAIRRLAHRIASGGYSRQPQQPERRIPQSATSGAVLQSVGQTGWGGHTAGTVGEVEAVVG
jgi:hypothetical protein